MPIEIEELPKMPGFMDATLPMPERVTSAGNVLFQMAMGKSPEVVHVYIAIGFLLGAADVSRTCR